MRSQSIKVGQFFLPQPPPLTWELPPKFAWPSAIIREQANFWLVFTQWESHSISIVPVVRVIILEREGGHFLLRY